MEGKKLVLLRTRIKGRTRYTCEDNLKGYHFYSKIKNISLADAIQRMIETRNEKANKTSP